MNVKIVNYNERRDSFIEYHKTGGAGLNYSGFESLVGTFQFAYDGVTDITGHGGSGKTEFALEILFYQSEQFGFRHLLYVPDIGSYKEIRRKLLIKYYRRSFRGYNNSIQEHEIIAAASWIDHHFLVIEKKDYKKPMTPQMIWEFAAEYRDENGSIQSCFIDSWKNLFHPIKEFGREDQYNDYILSFRNELAESACKHFMTIAHSIKTEREKQTDSDKSKRRLPDADDIKGGGWLANGKTIITVDRPNKEYEDFDVYFSKVKPDTIGVAKSIIGKFGFNWRRSRAYETIRGQMYYAGEAQKANVSESNFIEQIKEQPIQSTINLDNPFQDEPPLNPPF
jgi:hypothetical protein